MQFIYKKIRYSLQTFYKQYKTTAYSTWRRSVVVSALASINPVNRQSARLVLG